MSAIINSIIARKAGLPSHYYERTASATTKGHRHDEPGLRGHSVGDTFPYGVTGYGDRWAVTKHGAPLAVRDVDQPDGWSPAAYGTLALASRIAKHCAGHVTYTWPTDWASVDEFFVRHPNFHAAIEEK